MDYSIGWFSTGRDEAARRLLQEVYDSIMKGMIPARISYVFSNRERGESEESDAFFELVESLGLRLIVLSSRAYKPEKRKRGTEDQVVMKDWRREYDKKVLELLPSGRSDLVVLAGYMLIVGDQLCKRLPMINLHPAFPGGPKGTWQEVIWELIRTRAPSTGAMMHRVTEALDEGPAITFCSFPIRGGYFDSLWKDEESKREVRSLEGLIQEEGEENPLFQEIRCQGIKREIPLILYTIKAFAERKIRLGEGGITDEHGVSIAPYCLNEEIEAFLRKGSE